jgi:hypothetical protein
MLRTIPVTLAQANAFIARLHRHHPPVVGHKFSIGAWAAHGLCGVATVGHPVARMLDQRRLLEVNRLCTDGTRQACSFLYGAAARAAQAMGYFAILTYTLDEEGGASLRASGWWGEAAPDLVKTWHTPSRPNRKGGIARPKWRWVRFLSEWPEELPETESAADDTQGLLAL